MEVGWLPTLAHGVSGLLYVETENAFRIENFTYDGRGPGKANAWANIVCMNT